MSNRIGKHERLGSIRDVWPREIDFSDWLTSEAGLELLAESFSLEFENITRESRPGDYPCDLVGNLLGDEEHVVVIENQYGKTDHDHLGKVLTYAAVHNAMTGIWIAEKISDDHRKVVDWLNENTPSSVSLYLATVQLYRIGDSLPAPQLDIVCRPNYSIKKSNQNRSDIAAEWFNWRREMWTLIHEKIQASRPPFRLQEPTENYFSRIKMGRTGFHLSMRLIPRRSCIDLVLVVYPRWKEHAFSELFKSKAEIEHELGCQLDWKKNPGEKKAYIVFRKDINPRDSVNREAVLDWFASETPKMHQAFKPRIDQLSEPEE